MGAFIRKACKKKKQHKWPSGKKKKINDHSFFFTKLKFYVRKKFGDMHIMTGGELHRSLHDPKSKLLMLFLLQKALSVCRGPWGIILECWIWVIWHWFCKLFFTPFLLFVFFFLVASSSLSYPSHQLFLHYTLLFVSMITAFTNFRMQGI